MKRPLPLHDETAQDSFLDVVANLVGVIIILVMLVGTKAAQRVMQVAGPTDHTTAIPSEPLVEESALVEKIEQVRSRLFRDQQSLEALATHFVELRSQTAAVDDKRVQLAMHRQLVEEDLNRRRQELTAEQQERFDVQRSIVQSKIELEQLTQERLSLLAEPETVEEIVNVLTPIVREESEHTIHLRLKNGMVSIIPFDELLEVALKHFDEILRRLHNQDEVIEYFGPINGYRVKVQCKRHESKHLGGPQVGQVQQSRYDPFFYMLASAEIGQEVELAMAPGGTIHSYLEANRRKRPAVLVWLYPDSFTESRLLKKSLYEMGFPLEVRALPKNAPIVASTYGTGTRAQ